MDKIIAQREAAMINATTKKVKQIDVVAGINGGTTKALVIPAIIETIEPTFAAPAPIDAKVLGKKRKQTIKKTVTVVPPASKPIAPEPPLKKIRSKQTTKVVKVKESLDEMIAAEIKAEKLKEPKVKAKSKTVKKLVVELEKEDEKEEEVKCEIESIVPEKDIIFCLHVAGDMPNPSEKPECKEFQMNLSGNISRLYEKILGPLPEEGVARYLEGSIEMSIISYSTSLGPVGIFYPAGAKVIKDIAFDRRFNRIASAVEGDEEPCSYGDNYIIWSKDKGITHDLYKKINAMPLKYPRDSKWLSLL